jgi:hypothetical protein
MCAEAPGALRPELMPDQRVPRAPQVGTRSRPAPPAARRSFSSCSLPAAVPSAPTRSGEEASLISIDELTVTFSGTERLRRCPHVRRKPTPSGVEIPAALWDYNTHMADVDHADALWPLHDSSHASMCADVLR